MGEHDEFTIPGDRSVREGCVVAIDEKKLESFMGKVVGDLAAAETAVLGYLGDRLGLYRALAEGRWLCLLPGEPPASRPESVLGHRPKSSSMPCSWPGGRTSASRWSSAAWCRPSAWISGSSGSGLSSRLVEVVHLGRDGRGVGGFGG
jgi:hypothetical protein